MRKQMRSALQFLIVLVLVLVLVMWLLSADAVMDVAGPIQWSILSAITWVVMTVLADAAEELDKAESQQPAAQELITLVIEIDGRCIVAECVSIEEVKGASMHR